MKNLLTTATLTPGLLIFSSLPVLAEVCDKARPFWHPNGGRATQLDELVWFFMLPVGWIVMILFGVAMRFQRLWISIISATLISALAGVLLWDWYGNEDPFRDMNQMAYNEGCIAPPLLLCAVLFAIGLTPIILQIRNRRA